MAKCRECRWTQSQRKKQMPNIFCRFYAFRRLRYTKGGLMAVAGFCDPRKDAKAEDLRAWTQQQKKSEVVEQVQDNKQVGNGRLAYSYPSLIIQLFDSGSESYMSTHHPPPNSIFVS